MKTLLFLFSIFISTSVFADISNDTVTVKAGVNVISEVYVGNTLVYQIKPDPIPDPVLPAKLITISDMKYQGAVRFQRGVFGKSKLAYSNGVIAYNKDNNSFFIGGHNVQGGICEFAIPPLVISPNTADLEVGANLQGFITPLATLVEKNTEGLNKIGGMEYINGELLVHAYTYYDANTPNTDTSLVIRNAGDIEISKIDGFFKFSGAAHEVLWISPIPNEYQQALGGDYISGASSAIPINGRSSMGPSAFSFNSKDIIGTAKTDGNIVSNKLLDFSLKHVIADNELGWLPYAEWSGDIQYNYSGPRKPGEDFQKLYDASLVGKNPIWTSNTRANYGLIIPGTKTYAVFGSTGMFDSGGGYKIMQDNGKMCGGQCSAKVLDTHNRYWLFNVDDLIAVKNGTKEAHEVKPYERGRFTTPYESITARDTGMVSKPRLSGGTYDIENGIIYLTLSRADYVSSIWDHMPVVLAYKVDLK